MINKRNLLLLLASLVASWSFYNDVQADAPRVFPKGELPNDQRLKDLKHLNAYFPFDVPVTKEAWLQRKAELKQRVLVATGLWPMPKRTPLKPVIHGRVERNGFTVEKAYFESVPGHFVTGLLFRPKDKMGKHPAVLCPHGHGGRLQDYGADKILHLINQGAERFEDCGRYPKLSRCAQLARMGCVTFIYDMEGYADSQQLSRQLVHRFAKQRPEFDTKESWGFYSTQAELRLQSIMGLQTWNSVRGLDFLCSLPDVDPSRIGVTGGSGGGTQTILLCAIDDRPIVAFPNGMVSTSMQGGCTCENCALLRIGTGNVELAALFAPKPQGMTAANDWTREMMTKGYPELQKLYGMLGVKDKVICHPQTHFPHNYNYVTRAHMYSWFNKHLKLGLKEPVVEEHWKPLTQEEWTVWDKDHPAPEGGDKYERSLTRWLADRSDEQIAALQPTNEISLAKFQEVVGGAFNTIISRTPPSSKDIERTKVDKIDVGNYLEFTDIVRLKSRGEELPVLSIYPTAVEWNKTVCIWVDGKGKHALYDKNGRPRAEVRQLLDGGVSVVTADLLYQGEFLPGGKPVEQARVVSSREYAGYTLGYNHSIFAKRVHDILTLISYIKSNQYAPDRIHLLGTGGAGPLVAAARTQAGTSVERAAIDTAGFRFADLRSFRDPRFLSGTVKYGDLPALLALSSPQETWLAGEEGEVPNIAAKAYQAAGAKKNIESFKGKREDVVKSAVSWLLQK